MVNPSKETFIKNLKHLIKERGVKTSDMEASANISAGYISRLVGAVNYPSVEILISFANSLGVTVDSLLYGDYASSSQDESTIIKFLTRLLEDTTKETIVWAKMSKKDYLPSLEASQLAPVYRENKDGRGNWIGDTYNSMFYDENGFSLRSNIFKLSRYSQNFYLMPISKSDGGSSLSKNGFELYVHKNNKLSGIASAMEDDTSSVYDLMLSIFVAADETAKKRKLNDNAKKAIDAYLNGIDDIIF